MENSYCPFVSEYCKRANEEERNNAHLSGRIKKRSAFQILFWTILLIAAFGILDPAYAQTTDPTAPTDLTATAINAHKITLNWTAATDASGVTAYYVERCQGANCTNFRQITSTADTSFTNSSLKADTSYSYRVQATDSAGNVSPFSNVASATTQTPPSAPQNLQASAISPTQISLSWTPSTSTVGLAAYIIQRCQGAGCTNFSRIGTTNASTTTYVNSGLLSATLYQYRVRAKDTAGNLSSFSNVANATTQSAVPAPVITSTTTASGTVGIAFSYQITATNSPTSYEATGLPAGLSVNTAAGLISGTPTTPGTSSVTLSATNNSGTGNATLTLTVSAAAPTITSANTASGTVGTAFSYQITATNSPTSYGATGLPAGLSVNTGTGLISGTPTAAATSSVRLSATNTTGTGNATLTLTVSAAPPTITSANAASGTAGTAFSYQITATNSPTSYGAAGLPAGLSVSTSTGLISGTPTAAGTSTVTLSATNSTGTGSAILTLTIASAAQAQLSISPSSMAFGDVNVGGNSSKTVMLTNTGTATLTITVATISGAGYTMTLQPTSINAGADTTFTVTFAPTASGSASGSISITSNAPGSPSTIALSGTGLQAQIAATPSSVAFGTVTIGTTNSQSITLKNGGDTTLTFSQMTVSGAGFGQTGLSTSTTIAAGASASFNATFDPPSAGPVSGSITLTTNGTPSPLVISLSGTGQTSTVLLGASPTSLAFGNVLDQSSSQRTTSVTNNGNANVTISDVTLTGTGFSASGIINGTVLTPGQSATLNVTFAPASGGAASGTLTIASNATNSPATVSLSGTGTHSVVLTWSASPTNGVTYNVFRGTSSGGEGATPVNTSPITTLTFTDTNVTPGTTYYYTVEAVDSGGSSDPSNEVSAAIPNP